MMKLYSIVFVIDGFADRFTTWIACHSLSASPSRLTCRNSTVLTAWLQVLHSLSYLSFSSAGILNVQIHRLVILVVVREGQMVTRVGSRFLTT